eukprot:1157677-Amphidinium_carterae.1
MYSTVICKHDSAGGPFYLSCRGGQSKQQTHLTSSLQKKCPASDGLMQFLWASSVCWRHTVATISWLA